MSEHREFFEYLLVIALLVAGIAWAWSYDETHRAEPRRRRRHAKQLEEAIGAEQRSTDHDDATVEEVLGLGDALKAVSDRPDWATETAAEHRPVQRRSRSRWDRPANIGSHSWLVPPAPPLRPLRRGVR